MLVEKLTCVWLAIKSMCFDVSMLGPGFWYGQSNRYVFSHLTVNDGLPQTNLRDIFKDSRDFIGFVAMEELPDMMA